MHIEFYISEGMGRALNSKSSWLIPQQSLKKNFDLHFGNGPYSCHYHGNTTASETDQFTSIAMDYGSGNWYGITSR